MSKKYNPNSYKQEQGSNSGESKILLQIWPRVDSGLVPLTG